MHFCDPVAQAVQNQIANHRVIAIQRIAAAGIVVIPSGFRIDDIINRIIQPLEIVNRAALIALGGVIKNDIQNNFDSGVMHRLHKRFEFFDLVTVPAIICIGRFWGKKAD